MLAQVVAETQLCKVSHATRHDLHETEFMAEFAIVHCITTSWDLGIGKNVLPKVNGGLNANPLLKILNISSKQEFLVHDYIVIIICRGLWFNCRFAYK